VDDAVTKEMIVACMLVEAEHARGAASTGATA
jgi:hypothetical protein